MSSSTRTTSKGGKTKGDTNKIKHDKSDTGKGSGDKQHSGGGENSRSKSDDPTIKDKVRQVIEMTRRSEEEVCLALHECDYDTESAINLLFENLSEGTWETSSKKKKNRQASTSKAETGEAPPASEWNEEGQPSEKEKPRNKNGGGPPRLHGRHNDSRGWRGRENKENERNLEGGSQQDRKDRRGRPGVHPRGGVGRGRGGGRAGSRYPPRSNRSNFSNARPIETWDNATQWESTTITNSAHPAFTAGESYDDFPQTDDWSTEEYTGSLADTKVFTPSSAIPPLAESSVEALPETQPIIPLETMPSMHTGTLNAAQAQYLNQLTQQSSENMKVAQQYTNNHLSQTYGSATSQNYNSGQTFVNTNAASQPYTNSAQSYNASGATAYGNNTYSNNSYSNATENSSGTQHQPVRTKTQRARVPPPSKIPATAVEMPGELNSSIGFLDVQFGAMEFLSDTPSFDASDNKFSSSSDTNLSSSNQTPSTNLDLNQSNQSTIDTYSSTKTNPPSSISTALSQNLPSTDNIPQTSEHLASGTYSSTPRNSTVAVNATPTAAPSGLDINKQTESHSYTQPSTYSSYQPKTTTYQTQNYNSSNYNSTPTTSNNYVSNTQSYNVQNSNSTYQNSYTGSSSYQNNATAFPAITQSNSYPSNSSQYHQQANQSVYGANTTGLNSSSNYGSAPSGNQYSSYNASSNKIKESSYDTSTAIVSSTTTATSSANTTTLTASSTSSAKSTTTTLAKNSSNAMNIPPAAAPVMSTQYIMSQVPYFQQPVYSFEEMQLLHQQRLQPHVPTGYYDMSYQTPTTLTAVRDGTLTNVAYSISDGRFTRGDNNTSPVPSTVSQQTSTLTQGHQAQPMLAAQTAAAPFFYAAAPYNPMQTYQFGAVYPVTDRVIAFQQLPTVTNAHGSTNSQYPKPNTYGSAYASAYDQISQSQDYSKTGYVSNAQGQSKATGANASSGTTGNDLNALYGKSHAALGKVNSYEKQGFHSGTPPPFAGPNHGIQSTGLAPSGANYGTQMFIPTMPPHQQHHSTPLIHQQLHQMEVRHQGRRMDSNNTSGQRSQASSQAKSGTKQGYPNSYWNQA